MFQQNNAYSHDAPANQATFGQQAPIVEADRFGKIQAHQPGNAYTAYDARPAVGAPMVGGTHEAHAQKLDMKQAKVEDKLQEHREEAWAARAEDRDVAGKYHEKRADALEKKDARLQERKENEVAKDFGAAQPGFAGERRDAKDGKFEAKQIPAATAYAPVHGEAMTAAKHDAIAEKLDMKQADNERQLQEHRAKEQEARASNDTKTAALHEKRAESLEAKNEKLQQRKAHEAEKQLLAPKPAPVATERPIQQQAGAVPLQQEQWSDARVRQDAGAAVERTPAIAKLEEKQARIEEKLQEHRELEAEARASDKKISAFYHEKRADWLAERDEKAQERKNKEIAKASGNTVSADQGYVKEKAAETKDAGVTLHNEIIGRRADAGHK